VTEQETWPPTSNIRQILLSIAHQVKNPFADNFVPEPREVTGSRLDNFRRKEDCQYVSNGIKSDPRWDTDDQLLGQGTSLYDTDSPALALS
jgi:hypothetical protein